MFDRSVVSQLAGAVRRFPGPILCDNIKAAGVVIYTMHVNTHNDPTSAVLQYCASGSDKFSTVTLHNPDHGGLQLDRKLTVEVARRAIILGPARH